MRLPSDGKVLIIDDKINEALPLVKMLASINIPSMYFNGNVENFPETPFKGIRIVFLDLRFTTATGDQDVISNVTHILKRLIDKQNGPYILIVWSKHEDDYLELLKAKLKTVDMYPEFILSLNKSEFFETDYGLSEQFRSHATHVINDTFGDDIKTEGIVDDLSLFLEGVECFEKRNSKPDALVKIAEKLEIELRKANLFSLFVLWENTICCAKTNMVNEIFYQMPESIPQQDRLAAMLYYLAHYQLENSLEYSNNKAKFNAAIETLNELFYYFYQEETNQLSTTSLIKIPINEGKSFKDSINNGKYNTWIKTAPPPEQVKPGNIYTDTNKRFQPHKLLIGKTEEKYNSSLKEFQKIKGKKYVVVEISADCDIAQNKKSVSKIVPGILISEESYNYLVSNRHIKEKDVPDYLRDLGFIDIKTIRKDGVLVHNKMRLFFNLNLFTYCGTKDFDMDKAILALRKNILVNLQTELGKLISRQGIGSF